MTNWTAGGPLPARRTPEGIAIALRLMPKSGGNGVIGVKDGAADLPILKARVRAAPENGEANEALAELIAEWLGEPKTEAELVSGGKSRLKQILVRGDANTLLARLASRLAGLKSGD